MLSVRFTSLKLDASKNLAPARLDLIYSAH